MLKSAHHILNILFLPHSRLWHDDWHSRAMAKIKVRFLKSPIKLIHLKDSAKLVFLPDGQLLLCVINTVLAGRGLAHLCNATSASHFSILSVYFLMQEMQRR